MSLNYTCECIAVIMIILLIYRGRAKARKEANETAKNAFTEQWKTAHDIASLRALNSAFEDCQEGPHYSLGKYYTHPSHLFMRSHLLHRGYMAAGWDLSLDNWPAREANEAVRVYCRPQHFAPATHGRLSGEDVGRIRFMAVSSK